MAELSSSLTVARRNPLTTASGSRPAFHDGGSTRMLRSLRPPAAGSARPRCTAPPEGMPAHPVTSTDSAAAAVSKRAFPVTESATDDTFRNGVVRGARDVRVEGQRRLADVPADLPRE